MLVTLSVLKLLMFRLVRFVQLLNIHFMSVTLAVLNPLKSNPVREEQSLNR